MWQSFRHFANLAIQVSGRSETVLLPAIDTPLKLVNCNVRSFARRDKFHTSLPRFKEKWNIVRRRDMQATQKQETVVQGTGQVALDDSLNRLVFVTSSFRSQQNINVSLGVTTPVIPKFDQIEIFSNLLVTCVWLCILTPNE